jgi:methionyl aminopeptidase
MVYGFPAVNSISVNHEAAHGIPDDRALCGNHLIACAEQSFRKAMLVACEGFRTFEIGRTIEREVQRNGFFVIRELGGHGIGRTIHEPPRVPNFADFTASQILTEGLVITVEPIIAEGSGLSLYGQ